MNAQKTTLGNYNGRDIPTVIYTPIGYDSTKPYPVVFFLHGLGENGDGTMGATGLDKVLNSSNQANLLKAGDQYGFIVVAPQYVQAWNEWQPSWAGSAYINVVVEAAKTRLLLDLNRMYLTGLSAGGGGCWEYLTKDPLSVTKIAACVPICGTWLSPYPTQGSWSYIQNAKTPIWGYHAQNDPTVSVNATINQVSSAGASAQKTIYPTGGHGIWGTVYGDQTMYAWMLSKSISGGTVTPPQPTGTTKTIIAKHFANGKELTIYNDLSTNLV